MNDYLQSRKRSRHYKDEYESKKQNFRTGNRLPIFKLKDEFLNLLTNNQIIIVTGETGSGKSTQIPQYLLMAGYSKKGKIACTQPRRIGAISLATRVAEELQCVVGENVGYLIRFENCVSSNTSIVYMTDGVLLREMQTDTVLKEYSVVIIDEAHERTIQTDALLGLMKNILKKRPSMRLIISSATLNAEKFSKYYNATILHIPGRLYDVKISYRKPKNNDYIDDIVHIALKIHYSGVNGDVLIFLSGQQEINRCVDALIEKKQSIFDRDLPNLYILPAYSSLPKRNLSKIFKPTPKNSRKVIVATNIAETSLTIDGINFVIDSGFVKQKTYNPAFGIDQLLETVISRAQADQRAGRAGRTMDGKCYRIYSYNRYHRKMLAYSVPEIQRANLSNTVLQLKSIGITDIENFDFIDPPDQQRLVEAVNELRDMSALSDDCRLTILGRYMAQFPMDPILSKILIMSSYRGCSEEVIIIISMLCIQNIFDKPPKRIKEAERKRQELQQHQGDHITLLYIYMTWRDNGYSEKWCDENFCCYSGLKQAKDIINQLIMIMDRCDLKMVSCGSKIVTVQNTLSLYYFRRNSARKEPTSGYRTVCDDQIVYIHPSSALFRRQPEWVVFHDIMATSNKYMKEVTKINVSFLKELLPSFS